jgi:GNAT superfamily N-acetyltransferase
MYEMWLERCLDEGSVVVPDGNLTGFAGVRPAGSKALSVDLVYVDPDARGEGLASRLVRGALANADGVRAQVATQAWNVGGQRLYQEIGFRTTFLDAIVHVWLDDRHQSSAAMLSAASPPVGARSESDSIT